MKKLMVTVLAAGMAAAAWADAHISYSGQLRAANGEQLTGKTTGNIEFRIYDVPTEKKAPLWARDIAVQIDANGCFAVELHDSAGSEVQGDKPTAKVSLDDIIANNANLYLGLTVKGSSGEINPRQKLLSNPRAVFAENVSLAKGSFTVTGVATLSGGIEAGDNKAFTVSKSGDVYASGALKVIKPATFVNGATFSAASTFSKGATFSEASAFTKGATFAESATFTKGATFAESATFTKGISVTGGTYGVMPIGTIVMWWGDPKKIPDGWALCDGLNHGGQTTPDMRGRFPVGVNDSTVGESASGLTKYAKNAADGAESVGLTVSQLPAHNHRYVGDDDPANAGLGIDAKKASVAGDKQCFNYTADLERGHDQSHTYATTSVGLGNSHENRPPFRALYFIMRVK